MIITTRIDIICLLGLVISLFSCVDKIDFAQPEVIQNAIAIQGKLTKGNPSRVEVEISEVFNFSESPRLISAQYVELVDDSGNKVELVTKEQGIYQLDLLPDMAIDIAYGKGYKIKTALFDGTTYESEFDTLYPVTIPTDIATQKVQELKVNEFGVIDTLNFITFNTSTEFPVYNGQKINLLWEIESTFKLSDSPAIYLSCPRDCQPTNSQRSPKTCFINFSPVQNYKTLNTQELSGDKVTDFTIFTTAIKSFIFSEGFYLTVLQQSLSEDAHEYWSTVALLTNRIGSVFQAPAGRINSNIRSIDNEEAVVFGYFFATESNIQRIYVPPALADFPQTVCPAFPNPDGSGPGNCCDCLCELNSTLEQPEWWVE